MWSGRTGRTVRTRVHASLSPTCVRLDKSEMTIRSTLEPPILFRLTPHAGTMPSQPYLQARSKRARRCHCVSSRVLGSGLSFSRSRRAGRHTDQRGGLAGLLARQLTRRYSFGIIVPALWNEILRNESSLKAGNSLQLAVPGSALINIRLEFVPKAGED